MWKLHQEKDLITYNAAIGFLVTASLVAHWCSYLDDILIVYFFWINFLCVGTVFLRGYDSFCGISIRPSPSQLWGKRFQEVYRKPQDHSELKDHGRYDFTLGRWTCPSWLPTDPSDPFCGCAFVRLLWERGVLEGGSGFATWLGCICPEWSHQLWIWHVLLALHVSQPRCWCEHLMTWASLHNPKRLTKIPEKRCPQKMRWNMHELYKYATDKHEHNMNMAIGIIEVRRNILDPFASWCVFHGI